KQSMCRFHRLRLLLDDATPGMFVNPLGLPRAYQGARQNSSQCKPLKRLSFRFLPPPTHINVGVNEIKKSQQQSEMYMCCHIGPIRIPKKPALREDFCLTPGLNSAKRWSSLILAEHFPALFNQATRHFTNRKRPFSPMS